MVLGSKRSNIWLLALLIAFTMSCEIENTEYPTTPQIEFLESTSEIGIDDLGNVAKKATIKFYLMDGDGDMGLTQSDTFPPYTGKFKGNFFPTLYIPVDGKFIVDTSQIATNYRIPYVGNLGQDQALKAFVFVDFERTNAPLNPFPYDSILISFYVVDRRLHESNTVWTDTIRFTE